MDYHPLALLQMFAPMIKHPEGYPDAMPLLIALEQPDQDKFVDTMARELKQHTELKHWKVIHKSQVPRTTKPFPIGLDLMMQMRSSWGHMKWKA